MHKRSAADEQKREQYWKTMQAPTTDACMVFMDSDEGSILDPAATVV